MFNEIGSNFWLNPKTEFRNIELGTPEQFGCMGSDYVWMSTGRSAIKFVLKTIEERYPDIVKKALLPPFTCHTVIEPFLEYGWEVSYYGINVSLAVDAGEIVKRAKADGDSVVLIHRYFGFDTISGYDTLVERFRAEKIISIEDVTQCLYSSFVKAKTDFTVGSIRKWTGTPDGGFAVCREGVFKNKPSEYDKTLEAAKIEASYSKYNYMFCGIGEKEDFLNKYREAEDILDSQTSMYSIGRMSSEVQANLDVRDLKDKRQSNYNFVLKNIPDAIAVHPIFCEIESSVSPLYLPIFAEERKRLQSLLVANYIYAPVVWPKPECQPVVCKAAEELYEHILCIPIDQRYEQDDMKRLVEVIQHYCD